MRICVHGLWHLGSVTSACLAAEGFDVVGLDPDAAVVRGLEEGRAPLFEPGLDALIQAGLKNGRLSFSSDAHSAAKDADIVWVAFDTPVDDDDVADVGFVKKRVLEVMPYLRSGALVLISSQMPVGTIAEFERARAPGQRLSFACSPENLRLGKAIEAFRSPERIVVGVRDDHSRTLLEPMLKRFCDKLLWISIESAEMTKHALNGFLAVSVTFINEIATICERVGADIFEVEAALRSESRVGANAYVRPGSAFGGGTLARDVLFLTRLAEQRRLSTPVLHGVLPSNQAHSAWALRRALEFLDGKLPGATVAVLGLAYKPGTDSLRRSAAFELVRGLLERGAQVRAFDPVVKKLPDNLAAVTACSSVREAARGAELMVIATGWPEFGKLSVEELAGGMARAIVIDQDRALSARIATDPAITYVTLGRRA